MNDRNKIDSNGNFAFHRIEIALKWSGVQRIIQQRIRYYYYHTKKKRKKRKMDNKMIQAASMVTWDDDKVNNEKKSIGNCVFPSTIVLEMDCAVSERYLSSRKIHVVVFWRKQCGTWEVCDTPRMFLRLLYPPLDCHVFVSSYSVFWGFNTNSFYLYIPRLTVTFDISNF